MSPEAKKPQTSDRASQRALEQAAKRGVETAWDRFAAQHPRRMTVATDQ